MSEINDFGSATIRLPNWDAEIKALQERMQGYNEVELVMINDGNYSKMKNGGSSFVSFTDPTTGLTWGVPLQGGMIAIQRRISSDVSSLVKIVFTDLTIVPKRWSFFVLSNLRL